MALVEFAITVFVMYHWFRIKGELFHVAGVAIGLFVYWRVKNWSEARE